MISYRWLMICDRWLIIDNRWLMIGDRWLIINYRWLMIGNRWSMSDDRRPCDSMSVIDDLWFNNGDRRSIFDNWWLIIGNRLLMIGDWWSVGYERVENAVYPVHEDQESIGKLEYPSLSEIVVFFCKYKITDKLKKENTFKDLFLGYRPKSAEKTSSQAHKSSVRAKTLSVPQCLHESRENYHFTVCLLHNWSFSSFVKIDGES